MSHNLLNTHVREASGPGLDSRRVEDAIRGVECLVLHACRCPALLMLSASCLLFQIPAKGTSKLSLSDRSGLVASWTSGDSHASKCQDNIYIYICIYMCFCAKLGLHIMNVERCVLQRASPLLQRPIRLAKSPSLRGPCWHPCRPHHLGRGLLPLGSSDVILGNFPKLKPLKHFQ